LYDGNFFIDLPRDGTDDACIKVEGLRLRYVKLEKRRKGVLGASNPYTLFYPMEKKRAAWV